MFKNFLFVVLLMCTQAPNITLSRIFLGTFPMVHVYKFHTASEHLTHMCYISPPHSELCCCTGNISKILAAFFLDFPHSYSSKEKTSQVSSTSGHIKAVKRENSNTQFIIRILTYVAVSKSSWISSVACQQMAAQGCARSYSDLQS
jgi:hypothetical protein